MLPRVWHKNSHYLLHCSTLFQLVFLVLASRMELILHVPGLLLPDTILTDTLFDLSDSSLEWILGRGKRSELPADWLARSFGATPPLSAAALRKVGAGDWICLDPVHWAVTREGITLDDPARLLLHDDEAAALRESIAPLFAGWGMLSASAPTAWELQLSRPAALQTSPLPDRIGQPVDPALPGGDDGREWRRLIAEAQTLLHAHPVNRNREALGRPPVNSLWPWGMGALPAHLQTDLSVAWTTDPVLAGLAAHAGIPCLSPPGSFQFASGRILTSIEMLLPAARQRDMLAWRELLPELSRNWLTPALAAFRKGDLTHFDLVASGTGADARSVRFSLAPGDRWRFWCRKRPLTELK